MLAMFEHEAKYLIENVSFCVPWQGCSQFCLEPAIRPLVCHVGNQGSKWFLLNSWIGGEIAGARPLRPLIRERRSQRG